MVSQGDNDMIRRAKAIFHPMLTALLRSALAAVLASTSILWATTNKGPDAGSYTATDGAVFSFVDLAAAGGAASVLGGIDDGVAVLTLPFPFQFYGNTYTQLCASANGILTFITGPAACTMSSDFANADLTSAAPPGDLPALLPFWTDLSFQVAGSGAVFYQTRGTPGSRQFVVDWDNAFPQGSPNAVTFEVILSEGSNQILFQYQTVDLGGGNPANDGARATVGIRDSGGNTNGREIAWSYDAAVLVNSSAVLFTPPAGSETSVNTITSNPPGLQLTVDGVVVTTPQVQSWSSNSTHTLLAASPQNNGGVRNTFTGWSTGASTAQITIQAQNPGTTYTANFSTQYQLTTGVNPSNGGTITGGGYYSPRATATVQATAAAGYTLDHFSGDLSGSANPQTLMMTGPMNVVANFRSTATPTLTAAITGKANGSATGQRVWTIRLANSGLGTAAGAEITGAVLSQIAGTPCTPAASVVSAFPVVVGDIAPSANATGQMTIDFSGCPDATGRFSLKVSFEANSTTYTGSTTINNQTK